MCGGNLLPRAHYWVALGAPIAVFVTYNDGVLNVLETPGVSWHRAALVLCHLLGPGHLAVAITTSTTRRDRLTDCKQYSQQLVNFDKFLCSLSL